MGLFLYVNAVLREITNIFANRDRSVVTSSVIPSAKYCCSRPSPRFVKGRTTIDRRGATSGCEIEVAAGDAGIGVADAVASSAGFPARGREVCGQSHQARHTVTSAATAD